MRRLDSSTARLMLDSGDSGEAVARAARRAGLTLPPTARAAGRLLGDPLETVKRLGRRGLEDTAWSCEDGDSLAMTSASHDRDPRVDEYIEALPDWQRAVCRQVRDLVHAADPEVEETIKRRVQPYFVLEGNVCALLATKDHVNVFLYDGGIVPDPEGIITGGHDNKTADRKSAV